MGPRPRGRGVVPMFHPPFPGERGFNGAAPARARSRFATGISPGVQFWLQWGRARAGAESGG